MIDHRVQARLFLRQVLNNPDADFRDGQWEAIQQIVQERTRLLVVQRTGWGKSLVYFLATKLLRIQGSGPTLLISPLLALMRNQILAAERLHIRSATINSSNRTEWRDIRARLHANEIDILLVSPERLANDEFREQDLLPIAGQIGLFVVDEAHCISDWGHDFRPDYRRIVRVLQALPPNIPVLATTATANNRVIQDISEQIGPEMRFIRGSLERDSLLLQNIVLPSQAVRMAWLAENIPALPGSGIVYVLTVRDAVRVADWLQSRGIDAQAYHGQQESSRREELEQRLLDNRIKVLVSTSALGMGFDKPDLGFVIHFQKTGSVVHYYQQVGRAGRATASSYGILLSGQEDDDINSYFIMSAFPPLDQITSVIVEINHAHNGLTVQELEGRVNMSRGQIDKVLKILSVETPAPISKQGSRWFANPVEYQFDAERVARITEIRRHEQQRMLEYLQSHHCLMLFLRNELNDPYAVACGRCAVCEGQPILPVTVSQQQTQAAVDFLRRIDYPIHPRRRWTGEVRTFFGTASQIPQDLLAEEGRALCLWGDPGWGELVRRGMQVDQHFDDSLVQEVATMVRERWNPSPAPTWITCVTSLNRPSLVPNFAQRLADALGLPFRSCVRKVRPTEQQKFMNNTSYQIRNIADAFVVNAWESISGPVLLVDDTIRSRWTSTIVAALLRRASSGPVFPLALALTSPVEDEE